MPRLLLAVLLLLVAIVTIVPPRPTYAADAGVTAEQVDQAIERAVSFLKSKQSRSRGNWAEHPGQPGGVTALVTLAMLNAGVPVKDPAIQASLAYLRGLGKPTMTYTTSLQTMVFCVAEPEKDMALIRRNAAYLQAIQITSGAEEFKGTWAYSDHQGNGDNSNTQFALLALHEAVRAGVEIPGEFEIRDDVWRLALRHWVNSQRPEGSWGYYAGQSGTGSMTCAGITSVVIAAGSLSSGAAKVNGDAVQCCGATQENEALEKALDWMARNFSVNTNPSADRLYTTRWILYYLYGVERVGRMTGQRFIGRHDWYREGAAALISKQDRLTGYLTGGGQGEDDPVVATSLALLFLAKGRRPVLLAQLKHNPPGDWNYHRNSVANLTRYVERAWKRDLTWQVIDPRAATAEDLLQAPVLFISGRDGLDFTADEKENLRTYVNQGGFIFAENCCEGDGFDRDFEALMRELFPDSPLRLLEPDHPVWFAQEKVDPQYARPLKGLDACCRTSVIYCPSGNLSCYWELAGDGRKLNYSPKVTAEIAACSAIGANVLAYATGRQLRNKLDIPQVIRSEQAGPPKRGTLQVAKLRHNGGSDEAQAALANLLAATREQTELPLATDGRLISITDAQLLEHPVVFMHGRRGFSLSAEQRVALKTYLERGGFLFADAICANRGFADAFRREMKLMFPEAPLQAVPADDPLLTNEYRGYDLSSVTMRDPKFRAEGDPIQARLYKTAPVIEALSLDGRYAVVFSPYDMSCALENSPSLECKGYIRADAARLGANILLYALQQ